MEVKLGTRKIGAAHPPLIVAELSANHNGKLERAKAIIDAAKQAGVHAVKLQTYRADTLTLPFEREELYIRDTESLWKGQHRFKLYEVGSLPWEWHKELFEYCSQLDLLAFSSPFDETAVDFLESLEVPCYKIGSPEIVDLPLLHKVAATGKPVLLSTGGASLGEIDEAIQAIRKAGGQEIILLKCNAAYPAPPESTNLRTIPHLIEAFGLPVGLSDHTFGVGVAVASVALGACLIEKHLTLSRADGGIDSGFSMEPAEMALLVEESLRAWQALGKVTYGTLPVEEGTMKGRPSLYFMQDLPVGSVVLAEHLGSYRPNLGLPPKEFDHLIGLRLIQNVKAGDPVSWKAFKGF